MKKTLDIPDSLLDEARKIASEEGTTLRALVELGLRRVIDERSRRKAFRLRDASVSGDGLRPDLRDAGWDQIRGLVYKGRGG